MNKETAFFTTCGFLIGLILGSVILGPRVYQWRQERDKPEISQPTPPSPENPVAASTAMPLTDTAAGTAETMEAVRARLATLKQQLEANPNDPAVLGELGNLYMDAAHYPQAIDYYERAVRIRPDANVLTDLGICYRNAGKLDTALETFRQARKIDPGRWQALFNEAIVLSDLKRYDEARSVLAEVQREHPGDPEVDRFGQTLAQAR
jgi:tetratricopeptide (TPR) repeat protein